MGIVDVSLAGIGDLAKDLREAFTGEAILDPTKQLELLAKAQEYETKIIELQSNVIVAEAESEHIITSTWRPITMLVFVFIIANNYILVPYLNILFSIEIPALELTQNMWDLLKLGIGGYIAGRSIETSVKAWRGPKK